METWVLLAGRFLFRVLSMALWRHSSCKHSGEVAGTSTLAGDEVWHAFV